MTPVVYVVQNQLCLSGDPRRPLRPKFDLGPAERHGRLVYLLGASAKPFGEDADVQQIVRELREGLASYSDADHLLLIGSPVLMGWTAAIAADVNDGRVSVLQWSGVRREYVAVRANLGRLSDTEKRRLRLMRESDESSTRDACNTAK